MTFFKKVQSFGQTVSASNNVEGIVKVASEDGISRNDLIVHHNLTQGNVFTGENLIKVAEDEADSVLLVAVSTYEKLASNEINEDQALATITDAGLEADDFNEIADLIDKQAADAGVVAPEQVWEKVAEAHDFLISAGLDPAASLEFATEFSAADSEEAQDKVASEFDGLDESSIDKIAEAYEYLGDIEGADVVELMNEYIKEAGVKELAEKGVAAAKKFGGDISGKNLKAAKEGMKPKSFRLHNKKKAAASLKKAESDTRKARIGAGVGAGVAALGAGTALNKQASSEIIADDQVWDKVAEAHDFLTSAGLDPVTSMDFAENFSAADSEEAQDKVASEFDGLDESSIDKIAEAYEYLGDIEGVALSGLMAEVEKEAGVKELAEKGVAAAKKFGGDISGKNLKAAKEGMKPKSFRLHNKKKAAASLKKAESDTRKARIGAGVGAGVAALGAGTAAYNGRG